jgi:hypothetical protein
MMKGNKNMKTRTNIIYPVFTALAAMVLCLAAPAPALADQPASATGAGFFDNLQRVFAFTATRHMDGSVVGQGVLIRPNTVIFHYSVNCLKVVGNVATLSGVITNYKLFGSDEDFTGGHFWFRVVDNGEGRKAPADQMTLFWSDEPNCTVDCVPDCNGDLPEALPPISINSGNIQVRQGTQ